MIPVLVHLFAAYKRDLAKDVVSDTSGDFQKALLALLKVCSFLSYVENYN